MNLGDKIIDDQGNVKTFSSGQDARLYYLDFEGNRKKYLLEGEAEGGGSSDILTVDGDKLKYNNFDIQMMKRLSRATFEFQTNTYITNLREVTEIDYELPQGTVENAILEFKTGDTIEFYITGHNKNKINKPFDFKPNTSYIILIDKFNIFWTEMQNFNQ